MRNALSNLADRLKATAAFRFAKRNERGAIAVEVAMIAPILALIAFASYDLSAVTKSRDRAHAVFYTMADTLASRTDHVTCEYLDLIADLAYESFTTGNYASLNGEHDTLPDTGARDFRFQIRGLQVQDPATDPTANPRNLKARVIWAFHRTYNKISDEANRAPGELIWIPPEYRVAGEFYTYVQARHFTKPPLNLYDYFPERLSRVRYDYRLAPRYVPMIDLVGPEVANRCEAD
jgi:Flp pilus assembly pilin Flp